MDSRPTDDEAFSQDLNALQDVAGGIDFEQAVRDDSILGGLDDSVADKDYNPGGQAESDDNVSYFCNTM